MSADGRFAFVAGYVSVSSTDTDYLILIYNARTGRQLRSAHYNGTGNDDDDAASLNVSPDGKRWYVTGSSDGLSRLSDYVTLAYSL